MSIRTCTTIAIVCVISFLLVNATNAALVVVGDFDFADNATPAGFSTVGAPSYAGGQLVLDGSSGIFNTTTPLTATDEFVVEAIVNASSFNAFDFVVSNSVGVTNSGYGILQDSGDWSGIHMGTALFGNSTAGTGTPIALAVVRTGGSSQLYVNGSPIAGTLGTAPAAPDRLNIGFNPADSAPTSGFNGTIDRVRLSTITGSFSAADLLGPSEGTIIPEPGAFGLAILALGGLATLRWRRRRA